MIDLFSLGFFFSSKLFPIILVWNALWIGLLFRTYYYYCYCFLVTRSYHTLVFVVVVPLIMKSPVVGFLYFCRKLFYGWGKGSNNICMYDNQTSCESHYGELPLLPLHFLCFNATFLYLKGLKSNIETQHRPSHA